MSLVNDKSKHDLLEEHMLEMYNKLDEALWNHIQWLCQFDVPHGCNINSKHTRKQR